MWNGSRLFDSASSVNTDRKVGIVLFDEYTFTSGTNLETQLIKLKSKYNSNLANIKGTDYDYSFQTAEASKQIFTRLPSKVLTDANPDGVTRYYTESDTKNTKTAYMSSKFFVVSDLTSINVTNEIDERTVEDTSEDTSTSTESKETTSYSPLLYFTSLAVTVVLILALLAIVVKHVVSAIKKKKAKSQSYYNKDLREIAVENIKSKAKEAKFKEEYDYDNMEANIIEEPTEDESLQEEITEEAVEETAEESEETVETTEEATEANEGEAEEPSKE
jgi:hypothetical protein